MASTAWCLLLTVVITNMSKQFPFVHSSIASMLSSPSLFERFDEDLVESKSLRIRSISSPLDMETLADLAHASYQVLFDKTITFRAPLQGLVILSQHHEAAATLLALNYLESCIRRETGHTTGKAPLLKAMLEQLSDDQMQPILKLLLLPHGGLNLRNLLWHGFIGEIPRPWFSLVMVIIINMERNQKILQTAKPELSSLRSYPSIQHILLHPILDADLSLTRRYLPFSYQSFFDLSIQWRDSYPACSAAVLGIVLEHSLRLEWCLINDRPEDAMAMPNSYFVTLDGHGQRNQHDLILLPYYGEEGHRNQLVPHLGGGMIALLTDMFASSCGGPNIRAALAHGTWDGFLDEELSCMADGRTASTANTEQLRDLVQIMLVALWGLATKTEISYKPLLSYTATTTRNLERTLANLEALENHALLREKVSESVFETPDAILQLRVTSEHLRRSLDDLQFIKLSHQGDKWSSNDVFLEYESNVALAGCIAVRTLLADLANASETSCSLLTQAAQDLQNGCLSSRQYKRATRLCSMCDATISLYSFALHVAIRFLNEDTTRDLKAVERSRMCVSTFSTFLPTNTERAVKAVLEFVKGKAVKAVLVEKLAETKL